MLGCGAVSVEALLPHLSPTVEAMAEDCAKQCAAGESAARATGIVSLADREEEPPKKRARANTEADSAASATDAAAQALEQQQEATEAGARSNQLLGLLEALVLDRRWALAEPLLAQLERAGALPCSQATRRLVIFRHGSSQESVSPRFRVRSFA